MKVVALRGLLRTLNLASVSKFFLAFTKILLCRNLESPRSCCTSQNEGLKYSEHVRFLFQPWQAHYFDCVVHESHPLP